MSIKCFALILLIVSLPAVVFAETSFLELLMSKDYWGNQQWDNIRSDVLWADKRWQPYTGKENFKFLTIQKTQKLTIEGIRLEALTQLLNNSKYPKKLLLRTFEFQKNDCSTMMNWAIKHYGTPTANNDLSSKQENWLETTLREVQWDIGNTRITGYCFASYAPLSNKFSPMSIVFSYAHKDVAEKLKEAVTIKCSQQFTNVGIRDANPPRKEKDIIFIIDDERKEVLNTSKNRIKGTHTVTENLVTIKYENKDGSLEYIIDRNTGSFEGKVRMGASPTTGIDIIGSCERIKLEPKF
jgi:hypothetical protein